MKLLFTGDIMPGGVLPYCDKWIDEPLLQFMSTYDVRIATLECSLGENDGAFDPIKMNDTEKQNIVFVRKEDLSRLKTMNINIVSLANNHATDCGTDGLKQMIDCLDELGIRHVGAGTCLEEAKKPVVLQSDGKTMAIIAFQIKDFRKPWCFYPAKSDSSGVYYPTIHELVSYIHELKCIYEFLVLMPHWGEEHQYLQENVFRKAACQLLAAGADCIVGSHPHIINPVVKWKHKKCYFSLGNFLFPEKCMQVPRPMYYPATMEEFQSLKRVWTYPKSIDEPVVAVWKPQNRIGMMVEMEMSNKIKSRYYMTCLTADNVLYRYSSVFVRLRMAFWILLMHLPKYDLVLKVYKHRFNLLRRAVDKLPAFNIPVKL